jgi:hypothetical protein
VADHGAAGSFQTIEKVNSSKANVMSIVFKEAETPRTTILKWEGNTKEMLWEGCKFADFGLRNLVGNVAEESRAHTNPRH